MAGRQTAADALLVELLVEEMPPRLLASLRDQFAAAIHSRLAAAGFVADSSTFAAFATPRRLAVVIEQCRAATAARSEQVRGPAWSACFDKSGRPSAALAGFAAAHGCRPEAIKRADFAGRTHAVATRKIAAKRLGADLGPIIEAAAASISVPRLMRWANHNRRFVRPVRGILAMHGSRVLKISCLGMKSSTATPGHRARAPQPRPVGKAASYAKTLATGHKVIVDIQARQQAIEQQAAKLAAPDRLVSDSELVAENAAMSENPQVYAAAFGREFLKLPAAVIGSCLKRHMRCFILKKRTGKLAARFLLVADNRPAGGGALIVKGFERVVAARLADARFYWDSDRREIASGVHESKLAALVYHPRLGSMMARIARIIRVAEWLAESKVFADADAKAALAAARLCKLDLATHMIDEYPQLEGIMAACYFGEAAGERIAELVAGHLDAGRDADPSDRAHWPLVVATEAERLAGLLAAGERLAADRDPHGLRRCATRLAVVLARQPGVELCSLFASLAQAALAGEQIAGKAVDPAQAAKIMVAMTIERIRHQSAEILDLAKPAPAALVNAIVEPDAEQIMIGGYAGRIQALDAFLASSAGATLIAAHKRVANILRKSDQPDAAAGKLVEAAEIGLGKALDRTSAALDAALARGSYERALNSLTALAAPVDRFFAEVMVNVSDPKLRAARLELLARLNSQLNRVANLGRLSG